MYILSEIRQVNLQIISLKELIDHFEYEIRENFLKISLEKFDQIYNHEIYNHEIEDISEEQKISREINQQRWAYERTMSISETFWRNTRKDIYGEVTKICELKLDIFQFKQRLQTLFFEHSKLLKNLKIKISYDQGMSIINKIFYKD